MGYPWYSTALTRTQRVFRHGYCAWRVPVLHLNAIYLPLPHISLFPIPTGARGSFDLIRRVSTPFTPSLFFPRSCNVLAIILCRLHRHLPRSVYPHPQRASSGILKFQSDVDMFHPTSPSFAPQIAHSFGLPRRRLHLPPP